MAKIKVCQNCGREIPAGMKRCPACGGSSKPPVYKRWWFIVLAAILAFGIWNNTIGAWMDEADEQEAASREYIEVTVDQLYEELDDNALKAEDTYQDAYVAVRGTLGTIDSDGSYIGLDPLSGPSLEDIYCRITSDEQRDVIKSHSYGDEIVVKGKITDIGEIEGYSMTIDGIE